MERMTGVEAASSTVLHAPLRRGQGDPALRRAFLRAKHGRRPPGEAAACRLPFFFTSFLHFGHIHVFCEEGVKMCFSLFWLFSAVFLCGQFQYRVSNRWYFNVFVISAVFVWTIPVCVILTKGNSITNRV